MLPGRESIHYAVATDLAMPTGKSMAPTNLRKRRPIDFMRWLKFALALAAGVLGVVLMTHGAETPSAGERAAPGGHGVYTALARNLAQTRVMAGGGRERYLSAD
jgi:hypothetical protein